MNKTKIGWTDYTLNPIKGKCKMGCSYCYARKIYDRFKWSPAVKFIPEVMEELQYLKKPSKIFLCSTHEMFGHWIPNSWIQQILSHIRRNPQHTFQILTKNPERAKDWSFSENIWLGISLTGKENIRKIQNFGDFLIVTNARLKFISFEPLLNYINIGKAQLSFVDWVILGAQTNPQKIPEKEWVDNLISYFTIMDIPIFVKNNLKPLLGENLRQEFPSLDLASILTNRPFLGDKK